MFRAADTATPTTKYLPQLRDYRDAQGRKFDAIKRYYRHDPKSAWAIQPAELQAIFDHGFWFGAVFQGGKSSETPGYYNAAQGRRDAEAAVRNADIHQQPEETAIGFAVDTDIINKTIDQVCEYFAAVQPIIHARRLWVEGYGDDRVCRTLQERNLIDVAWLANAKGWREDKAFEGWAVRQEAQITLPFGLAIDPNDVKDLAAAGYWRR